MTKEKNVQSPPESRDRAEYPDSGVTRRQALKQTAVTVGAAAALSSDAHGKPVEKPLEDRPFDQPRTVDCAIVGAGIAGLSAGLFLGRAGKSTVVFDGGKPRIEAVSKVREFIGFDGQSPAEVLGKAKQEVLKYGAEIREAKVTDVQPLEDGMFEVTGGDEMLIARSVVLATGITDDVPKLANLKSNWGDDLRVCPCFDGYEMRDKRFVVFGKPHRLARQAAWVSVWSKDVTIITNHQFDSEETKQIKLLGIKVLPGEVSGVVHSDDDKLVAVTVDGDREVVADAAWVVLSPEKAASPLVAKLCDVNENGIAEVDSGGRSSREGVFVIGNASFAWGHLAHAAAAGTNVGPIVANYLLQKSIGDLRSRQANEPAGSAGR